MAKVFEQLGARQRELQADLQGLKQTANRSGDVDDEVNAAMAAFDRLPESVSIADDFTAVTAAFNVVNAQVFLAFKPVQLAKRTVNRVRCGKIMFGNETQPVEVYKGPRPGGEL